MNIPHKGFIIKNKHGIYLIRRESDDCFWLYLYRREMGWNALRRLTTQQVNARFKRKMADSQAEFFFRKGEEFK